MDIRVLGCSGGVGMNLRTTTIMIDDDVLIDAGTGVGDLSIEEMARVRHIFLTHSHLDHIAYIPLLVDTLFDQLDTPLTIHGQPQTINALQTHIFNNTIWPDFARLPNAEKPVMRYEPMLPGDAREVGERRFEMIEVNHIVPGVGYRVANASGVFAFSGDTTTNENFWKVLNEGPQLDLLIVEAAFPNRDINLCRQAGHYCAELLAPDLAKLRHHPEIYISHTKPGAEDQIFAECEEAIGSHKIKSLQEGARFKL